MPRRVTLVLQRRNGEAPLGEIGPLTVEPPWWSEVESVVAATRREFGMRVTVLRLLHSEPDEVDSAMAGGTVTYLAELHGEAPAGIRPTHERLDDHPLRLPWARAGGPDAELAWARAVLERQGRRVTGEPAQVRTWNLSSIWTIPTDAGRVWLKSVPPFFAHEGPVIDWLDDPALPSLLGSERGRVLAADIPGADQYGAPEPVLMQAVDTLVAIQDRVASSVDELFALGLPDWRWAALRALVDDVVARHGHELDALEQSRLAELLAQYDARAAAIDACGVPVSLVHGDFHPGNLRAGGDALVILDWGDCGVGCPLLDVAAMAVDQAEGPTPALLDAWARAWIRRRPHSAPERALSLVLPLAALRQAVIYRGFLDRIEPSERGYHAADPAKWLRAASVR